MLTLTIVIVAGYLLGSLPASVLAGRLAGIDIREHGSGNAGASNVLRTLGWKPALAVFIVDVAKGATAAWIGGWLSLDALPIEVAWLPVLGGAAAVVGHIWPVWIGFRGGKGVATALGVSLVLAPIAATVALAVFILCVALTRRISIGSLAGSAALPVMLWVLASLGRVHPLPTTMFAVWFALMVFWTHRTNMRNLLRGTEPRLGGGQAS